MTLRVQRKAQKMWKNKVTEHRQQLVLQNVNNVSVTPSISDVDDQMPQRNFHKSVIDYQT